MPERAKVTSVEVIGSFRAKLIVYRDKAGRVLDEISDDVTRTRLWLQTDRPSHWRTQISRRTRELEQAQQELFSAQLSGLREASYVQQEAVRRARQALRDAEERLHQTQHWNRQFDHRVEPLARHIEKLRHILDKDMGSAAHQLAETIRRLEAYAGLSPEGSPKDRSSHRQGGGNS